MSDNEISPKLLEVVAAALCWAEFGSLDTSKYAGKPICRMTVPELRRNLAECVKRLEVDGSEDPAPRSSTYGMDRAFRGSWQP